MHAGGSSDVGMRTPAPSIGASNLALVVSPEATDLLRRYDGGLLTCRHVQRMILKRITGAWCLLWICSAFAAEPSGASSAQNHGPMLDNTHCDAYRNSVSSVRTPKDFGMVALGVDVSAQGEVLGSEVVERTTTNYFAHVVQENFSKCRFDPALENGVPVRGHQVVRLNFSDHASSPNNATCPVPFSRELPPSVGPMVTTKLRITFTRAGRAAAVDVLQPSGIQALDDAAVKAYSQCHFDPDAAGQPAFQDEWITTVKWSS